MENKIITKNSFFNVIKFEKLNNNLIIKTNLKKNKDLDLKNIFEYLMKFPKFWDQNEFTIKFKFKNGIIDLDSIKCIKSNSKINYLDIKEILSWYNVENFNLPINELIKYIDFYFCDENEDINEYSKFKKGAFNYFRGNYTYMIGHQPSPLDTKKRDKYKKLYPKITSNIDFRDVYWTDNVGDIFNIDYNNLEYLSDLDLYKVIITIKDKEFEILIENDCGFAVAYGPKEIYEFINNKL